MNAFVQTFAEGPGGCLMLALVHTLWQGSLWAAAVFLVLWWLPARYGTSRYLVALVGLLVVPLAGMATWAVLMIQPALSGPGGREAQDGKPVARPAATSNPVAAEVAPPLSAAPPIEPLAPRLAPAAAAPVADPVPWRAWAAAAWLVGVGVMVGRLTRALTSAGGLRRRSQLLIDAPATSWIAELCRTMGLTSRVRVATSNEITMPCAIGVLWPIVLLPAAMVAELPVDQLRLILAHELAHVRRWDYLVHVLELLLEAVLFFNPAVWWLSRQVRVEREACCDAAAIATTGQRIPYAQVLVEVAERLLRVGAAPQPAPAWSGNGGRRPLHSRVMRVLQPRQRPIMYVPWYSLAAVATGLTLALALFWHASAAAADFAAEWLGKRKGMEELVQIQKEYVGGPFTERLTTGSTRSGEPSRLPERRVVLKFQAPEGAPPPRGSVHIDIGYGASQLPTQAEVGYSFMRVLPIRDGRVEFDAPVPSHLGIYPDDLLGYTIDSEQPVLQRVEAGKGPQVIEVPVHTAGAIYGRLLDQRGRPWAKEDWVPGCVDAMIWTTSGRPGEPPEEFGAWIRFHDMRPGSFMATPLPIGHTYILTFAGEGKWVFSDPLTLDEAHPVRKIEVRCPPTVAMRTKVRDEAGRPIAGAQVHLEGVFPARNTLSPQWNDRTMFLIETKTDRQGDFTLKEVNPRVPGKYRYAVLPVRDYAPQAVDFDPDSPPSTVTLTQRGRTVSGKVLDRQTGRPLAGLRVTVRPNSAQLDLPAEADTNDGGAFRFSNLPPAAPPARDVFDLYVHTSSGERLDAVVDGPRVSKGAACFDLAIPRPLVVRVAAPRGKSKANEAAEDRE